MFVSFHTTIYEPISFEFGMEIDLYPRLHKAYIYLINRYMAHNLKFDML